MLKLLIALFFCCTATPSFAAPALIGSMIISAFLSSGLGALLPAVSATLVGSVVLTRVAKR